MEKEIEKIRKLIGAITYEQLRYVDCFIGEDIGLFMPLGGACFFALTPMHSHPSYLFILSFNNQTSLKINGKVKAAMPGKIFALSPHIAHHELPSDYPPRYIAVFIDEKFFKMQLIQYPVQQDIIFRGESFNIAQNLLPLLKNFMIEAENKIYGSEAVLRALSLEICHSVIRSILDFIPVHDRVSNRVEIDRVIEYLHSHIGERITVEEMAKISHMSVSHFSRIFRQETGKSPLDYFNQIRMGMVKKFLLAGDKSITEIALECGFNNASYLSARFYKTFKMSPTEYLKSLKKGSISKKKRRISKD